MFVGCLAEEAWTFETSRLWTHDQAQPIHKDIRRERQSQSLLTPLGDNLLGLIGCEATGDVRFGRWDASEASKGIVIAQRLSWPSHWMPNILPTCEAWRPVIFLKLTHGRSGYNEIYSQGKAKRKDVKVSKHLGSWRGGSAGRHCMDTLTGPGSPGKLL